MADLPRRQLGRTGLQVTVLGYGASELEGDDVTEVQAERILNSALDAGINYFDTAIDYGLSADRIGRHISNRRAEYYLASKCGCGVDDPLPSGKRPPHVFTPEGVIASVNRSLELLRTDYLDVVLFHTNPSRAQLAEQGGLQALQNLKAQGKVRWIGMSGWLPNLKAHVDMGVFDVFIVPYSLLWREHEDVIGEAARSGAGIIVRNGAAKGGPGKAEGDYWEAWKQAEIDDLLGEMTRMEFVLRFTHSHPSIDTNIVGTVNLDHLRDNVRSVSRGPLPLDVYEEARRRLPIAGRPDHPEHLMGREP